MHSENPYQIRLILATQVKHFFRCDSFKTVKKRKNTALPLPSFPEIGFVTEQDEYDHRPAKEERHCCVWHKKKK